MIGKETFAWYIQRGWSVIPWVIEDAGAKVKKYAPIKWKEYQSRYATDEEITSWHNKYNAIAVVCGEISNVVVVDIDEPDQSKYPYLGSPITVKSPFSNGRHYYYQYTQKLSKLSTHVKISGLPMDFRGNGGVAILPPSTLGSREYVFERDERTQLPELPDKIFNALTDPKPLFTKNKVVLFDEYHEGNRNDMASRVAGKFLSSMEPEIFESAGWTALQGWNARYCKPPLAENELRRTFESIRDTELRNRLKRIDFTGDFNFTSELEKQIESERSDTFFSGYDRFDGITNGFIYANTYLVAGLEKSGKSSWLMYMLQKKLEDGVLVGYVNTELPQLEFTKRMTAYWKKIPKDTVTHDHMREWTSEFGDRLQYLGVENMPDQAGMIKQVEEFIRSGIECLIFDNITSWGNKSQAKEGWQVMADLIDNLIQVTKRTKIITFMVIHLRPSIVENAALRSIKELIKKGEYDQIFTEQAMVVRKPSLSDVYGGGGALSQVSGTILIWRPFQKFTEPHLTRMSAVIAESFRNAPNGQIPAHFDGSTGVFVEKDSFSLEEDALQESFLAYKD